MDYYGKNLSSREIDQCIALVSSKSYEKFRDDCMDDINNQPILRFYCKFKLDFGLEPYLLCIRNYKIRNALTKFRLSSHVLNVEKGRHTRPKTALEERICTNCNQDVEEDEYHLLFNCSLYDEQRKLLVLICNVEKDTDLMSIMNMEDDKVFYLAMFIYRCFRKREIHNV